MIRTVAVCEAQVPFIHGGAEYLVRELVRQFQIAGYETERVSVPFKWYPKTELLRHAAAWRLLDLSETNGRPIDLAVATKFPTYFVRHPRKVTWLLHQHRAAYELAGTIYGDFEHTDEDVSLRAHLMTLDSEMLGESRRLYSIARNTAARAARFNNLSVDVLYHPPRLADRMHAGPYGNYVLSVGRLETIKRVDLAIHALAHAPSDVTLVVAGTGSQDAPLRALAVSLGLDARVRFVGNVDDDALIELYAGALAVVFPPFDEDFGYVTLEAFLAHKAVVTTTDAGEPTEFVTDDVNGYVTEATAEAIGAAFARLADRAHAQRLGDAGYERARTITWMGVVEQLVGAAA